MQRCECFVAQLSQHVHGDVLHLARSLKANSDGRLDNNDVTLPLVMPQTAFTACLKGAEISSRIFDASNLKCLRLPKLWKSQANQAKVG